MNRIFYRLIDEAIQKKNIFEQAQQRHQERVARRLKNEMVFIRAAQAERDRRQLEEELRDLAFERIEWEETLDFLHYLKKIQEFDR